MAETPKMQRQEHDERSKSQSIEQAQHQKTKNNQEEPKKNHDYHFIVSSSLKTIKK